MLDCINNSQPAIAKITYIDDSIERVLDVEKAFMNESSYILKCTNQVVILTLSTIKKIEMLKMQ